MKVNEMICPTCGHRFFTECSYGTCDACQTFFYASQQRWPSQSFPVGSVKLFVTEYTIVPPPSAGRTPERAEP